MSSNLLYVPNTLSGLRALLGLFILLEIVLGKFTHALLLFFLALCTDLVDGAVARKYKATSKVGERFLEPVADTMMVIPVSFALLIDRQTHLITLVGLGLGTLLYFLAILYFKNTRFYELRRALEPTLYGILIVFLGFHLGQRAGDPWVLLSSLGLVVILVLKFHRIRYHLHTWRSVRETSVS